MGPGNEWTVIDEVGENYGDGKVERIAAVHWIAGLG